MFKIKKSKYHHPETERIAENPQDRNFIVINLWYELVAFSGGGRIISKILSTGETVNNKCSLTNITDIHFM